MRPDAGSVRALRFAGFLPVCYYAGCWHALLGRETDGWGAFGGGPEQMDGGDGAATACREALEESQGELRVEALRAAQNAAPPLIDTARVRLYAVAVPRNTDKRIGASLRRQRGPECEKIEVRWIKLADLGHGKQRPVRWVGACKLRAPLPVSTQDAEVQRTLWSVHRAYDARHWTRRERQGS